MVVADVHPDGSIALLEVMHVPQQLLAALGRLLIEVLNELTHNALIITIIG